MTELEPAALSWQAYCTEVPVAVHPGGLLGQTADAAMWVSNVRLYTKGIAFNVDVLVRPEALPDLDLDMVGISDESPRSILTEAVVDGRLLRTLADPPEDVPPTELLVASGGSNHDGCRGDAEWWVSEIPERTLEVRIRSDIAKFKGSMKLDAQTWRSRVPEVVTL